VRQFLFDTWHAELLDALSRSIDARIAAVAQKVSQEVAYHVERSAAWTVRLGDGSEESHARAQAALAALWPYTGELFGSDDVERELARAGVACELETLRAPWLRRAGAVCAEATLAIPDERWAQGGGRSGRHSEHLGYLLAEMQAVRRSVPGDNW